MTPKIRVLITDADAIKVLAIVRALGDSVEVFTASHTRVAAAAWSRHVRKHLVHPEDLEETFVPWVLDACRRYGISAVITPDDRSSLLLARERKAFSAANVLLTMPDVHKLCLAMDKAYTVRIARQLGVPVPPTRIPTDLSDIITAAHQIGYPAVIKPRQSFHWTGTRFIPTDGVLYADSDRQLREALKSVPADLPPPLLQAYVPGRGVGINMLLGEGGELCAEFAYERIRDVRPTGAGSVLRRSIPMDERLRYMSLQLLRELDWWGVAMVEFRVDDSIGCPYLMEINGRFWGSLQLAIDAGVNFPRMLLDLALGKPVESRPYQVGVVSRWWLGDFRSTMRVLRGRPAGYTGVFPGRLAGLKQFLGRQPPGTLNQVFRWDDPMPALAEIAASARR